MIISPDTPDGVGSAGVNRLFFGDNLDVLRKHIQSESVDLVYLDPPFNSNRSYNVLFRGHKGEESQAQIEAFDDTWHWTQQTDDQYDALVAGGAPIKVSDAIEGIHKLLGRNDVFAYLVMMTSRLVELHRVLKPTGSLYLHCDPVASHYLKILLDAIFNVQNFRSEIVWKRTTAHSSAKRYGPVHDVILFYSKSNTYTWNQQFQPYGDEYVASKYRHLDPVSNRYYRLSDLTGPGTRQGDSGKPWRGYDPTSVGRHWAIPGAALAALGGDPPESVQEALDQLETIDLLHRPEGGSGRPEYKRFLEDMPGIALQDVWTDIDPINSRAAERLGYPTQKPLALLERIIAASSNEGDIILDPFCGCGTTIDAAQKVKREWVGIDITYLAVDLIQKRLRHTYGDQIASTYVVRGIPTDLAGAQAMFNNNPFEFERWAVSLVDGQPNEKQVGDKGIDGRVRFHASKDTIGTCLVSVKGGRQLNPGMVRDLVGTISQQKAEMGLLLVLGEVTKGMKEVADQSGSYTSAISGTSYPKVQILTISDLLAHKKPRTPEIILPYVKARPYQGTQQTLL